jgi:tRNA threonylcarbamoyladenosine biosynthesis protein TsaE
VPALCIRTGSEAETERVGEALGAVLRGAVLRDGGPAVVALAGPLGAGKTRLVRGLARGLGVAGTVRSPTFTLIHEHRGEIPLYHVDLYRLGENDVGGLGLEEVLDARAVTAIEWPDAAGGLLPAEHLRVEVAYGAADSERRLCIRPRGARYASVAAALAACGSWR